jgi:hypothetical protein
MDYFCLGEAMKEQIKACQEALILDPTNREAFNKLAEI